MIILQALKHLLLIMRQMASNGRISMFYCSWVSQRENWIKQKAIKYRSHSVATQQQNTDLSCISKNWVVEGK